MTVVSRPGILLLSAALGLFPSGSTSAQAASPYDPFGVSPGPFAVGMKVIRTFDHARTFGPAQSFDGKPVARELSRPIQIVLWYPAIPEEGALRTTLEDYAVLGWNELEGREPSPAERTEYLAALPSTLGARVGNPAALKSLVAETTLAVRNAPQAPGSFPLIVYAASFGSQAAENFLLCELLASHGFIVGAVPSVGRESRVMTLDPTGAEAQVRDLEFLLSLAHDLPGVDLRHIGTAGFSWGGLTSTALAMRNARISVAVNIDGPADYAPDSEMARHLPGFDPGNLRIPYLMLLSQAEAEIKMPPDAAFFPRLKYASVLRVKLNGVAHGNFGAWGTLLAPLSPDAGVARRLETIINGHRALLLYAPTFFRAYLKGDAAALENLSLSPEKMGLPEGFAELTRKAGQEIPPSEGEFLEILSRQGIQEARKIFAKFKSADPEWVPFREVNLNRMGYQLLQMRRASEAVGVLALAADAFPASANAQDSLGEAFLATGDLKKAEEAYRKALELLPKDRFLTMESKHRLEDHIRDVLKEIEKRQKTR